MLFKIKNLFFILFRRRGRAAVDKSHLTLPWNVAGSKLVPDSLIRFNGNLSEHGLEFEPPSTYLPSNPPERNYGRSCQMNGAGKNAPIQPQTNTSARLTGAKREEF